MYLLKPYFFRLLLMSLSYLHSTMYLLKPKIQPYLCTILLYLHSTMYLLKLIGPPAPAMALIFTFHYVSIKTESVKFLAFTSDIFTFHYVSIKTTVSDTTIVFFFNLHSTMYLLKLSLSHSFAK